MFQWLANLFKSDADRIEERLLKLFDFLLRDHGFAYAKEELGDAVDKNGKFVFYGPMIAYQFYKDKICISILHLAQRDEYNVYILYKGEKLCFDDEDLYEKVKVGDTVFVLIHKGFDKHGELKHTYLSVEY